MNMYLRLIPKARALKSGLDIQKYSREVLLLFRKKDLKVDQIEKSLWLGESVWNGEYYTYRKSSRWGSSKLFFHFELNRNILQWKQNWSDVVEGQDTQSGLFPVDWETIKSYSDKPESKPRPSLREGRTITTTYNGLVTVRHFRLCGLLGWLFFQLTSDWPAFCELHVGWKKQNITCFCHKYNHQKMDDW